MLARKHRAGMLPGNRLHLAEGPIDLVIWADGAPAAVAEAYRAAERRFDGLLAELVAELALLRMPLGPPSPHATPTALQTPPAWGEGMLDAPTVPSPLRGRWRHIEDMPPAWAPGGGRHVPPEATPTPNPSRRVEEAPSARWGGEFAAAALKSPIARRMAEACWPHRDVFITPMAAVAGAVAEAVLNAMTDAAPLTRAYVNNGGDIALHLTPGTSLGIGIVRSLEKAMPEGEVRVAYDMPVRGIATSGRHGRSFSLGIADAVTVLACDAPSADAAATIIANAVTIDDPAVLRRPARDLDTDSDLGDIPVTVDVGPLTPSQVVAALDAGVACAESLRSVGLIEAALLTLAGEWRSAGSPPAVPSPRLRGEG
jgi:uncharacterized protein